MAALRIDPVRLALAYVGLRTAADVGDHWLQTDHQALNKGWHDGDIQQKVRQIEGGGFENFEVEHRSAEGRKACAAHVASYVAVQGATVIGLARVTGVRLSPGAVVAGLTISGVTHYWADRRRPLKKLAHKVGQGRFYDLVEYGMSGAYCLDQAFHHTFELVAAAVIAAERG